MYCRVGKIDKSRGQCKWCNCTINVAHGSEALDAHRKTEKHTRNRASCLGSQRITSFTVAADSEEAFRVAAVEATLTYHGVKHHHSYASQECGNCVVHACFPESPIARKISCARTKAEAIAMNVLAPHAIEQLLEQLKHGVYFSIATDASNRGNRKMYPLALRYFSVQHGVREVLLDFYEDANEDAESICNRITSSLQDAKLPLNCVSAFSADNASVNFGIHNGVYARLRNGMPTLVRANCNCHVVYDCANYAFIFFAYDVEDFILKVYAEFSRSAKRVEALKRCFEFANTEYHVLLRHVSTRWLSLRPAIERILECWEPLVLYFSTITKQDCPPQIWKFITDHDGVLPVLRVKSTEAPERCNCNAGKRYNNFSRLVSNNDEVEEQPGVSTVGQVPFWTCKP